MRVLLSFVILRVGIVSLPKMWTLVYNETQEASKNNSHRLHLSDVDRSRRRRRRSCVIGVDIDADVYLYQQKCNLKFGWLGLCLVRKKNTNKNAGKSRIKI